MMENIKITVKRIASFISAIAVSAAMTVYIPDAAKADEEINAAVMIDEMAALVNEARKEAGLEEVYVLPYLNEVAEIRAIETALDFDHRRRDGLGFETAIDSDMVAFDFAAENLAAGSETAEETFRQWKESESHWASIMTENVTHMGIGVVYDEDTEYGYYWQMTLVSTEQEFAEQYLPAEDEVVPQSEGDITGDGAVDMFDYLALTEYLDKTNKGMPVHFNAAQLETADCFGDGIISEADAKVMAGYILGEYTELPYIF